MPDLTYFFDLRPWDIPRLTVPELEAYLASLKQIRSAKTTPTPRRR